MTTVLRQTNKIERLTIQEASFDKFHIAKMEGDEVMGGITVGKDGINFIISNPHPIHVMVNFFRFLGATQKITIRPGERNICLIETDYFNSHSSIVLDKKDIECIKNYFDEEKEISTLEGFIPSQGKASGNTTRLVDRAIQIIMDGHTCIVEDHYEDGANKKANRRLAQLIIDRLISEHEGVMTETIPGQYKIRIRKL